MSITPSINTSLKPGGIQTFELGNKTFEAHGSDHRARRAVQGRRLVGTTPVRTLQAFDLHTQVTDDTVAIYGDPIPL